MSHFYLGLGSNVGNRLQNMIVAMQFIQQFADIDAYSKLYKTAPMYYTAQNYFYNAVIKIHSVLEPVAMLGKLQAIEQRLGRTRPFANAPRPIDLDIISHDQTLLQTPALTLPHAGLAERAFVLQPLADIAPTMRLPGYDQTVAELLAALPADQGIETAPDHQPWEAACRAAALALA